MTTPLAGCDLEVVLYWTIFKGYGLMTAGLILPFWVKIRLKVLTRAVAWMTAGYVRDRASMVN